MFRVGQRFCVQSGGHSGPYGSFIVDATNNKGVRTKNPIRLVPNLARLLIPSSSSRGRTDRRPTASARRTPDAVILFSGLLILGAALGARAGLLPWLHPTAAPWPISVGFAPT